MRQSISLQNTYLVIAGIGIGWLVGLSVSPVVSIVITSVTGTIAAIVATLSGLKDDLAAEEKAENKPQSLVRKVDPAPIAMLVIGLFLGSTAGIWVRTHDWLSPRVSTVTDEITQWTTVGLPQEVVVNRLFESKYLSSNSSSTGQQTATQSQASVLFSEEAQTACQTLTTLVAKENYDELRTELLSSSIPSFRELPTIVTDTVTLAQIVEMVLCIDTAP